MSAPVPAELTGLWRREAITAPGLRDETTRVLWLQTRSWFVDIRVPADRPQAGGRRSFAAFADAELVKLARVEGFAGELRVQADVCFWRRDLDHQPAAELPDEGRFTLDGDLMIEDGIHTDYQEIWRREPESRMPLLAFELEADQAGRRGVLVVGDRHMLEFVARPGPAPQGSSLAALVETELAAGRRAAAEALLSTRIRYATADADGGWTVRLSSLPWLKGEAMWPRHGAGFDPATGLLEIAANRWRLVDASPDADPARTLGAAIKTLG